MSKGSDKGQVRDGIATLNNTDNLSKRRKRPVRLCKITN